MNFRIAESEISIYIHPIFAYSDFTKRLIPIMGKKSQNGLVL